MATISTASIAAISARGVARGTAPRASLGARRGARSALQRMASTARGRGRRGGAGLAVRAAEDDAGYCFEAEDEEDEAQVQLREQAAAAMKQRDLKLSLQAKEVHFRSRLFFGPFRLPRG